MSREYVFRIGDFIRLESISSSARGIGLRGRIRLPNGKIVDMPEVLQSTNSDRTIKQTDVKVDVTGEIIQLSLTASTWPTNPGETYVKAQLIGSDGLSKDHLARGYLYESRGPLNLGHDEGSLDGRGHLHIEDLADDVAGNVVTTWTPTAANLYRKIYGILIYVNCDGNSASRVPTINLRQPWGDLPTGFTEAERSDLADYIGPTLTANEEGLVAVINMGKGDGFLIKNDNGTVTTSSTVVLPLTVLEDDPITIPLTIASGLAGDKYSAYALMEDWIAV